MTKIFLLLLFIPQLIFSEKPQFWQTISQPLGKVKEVKFSFKQQYRFHLSDFKTLDARFSLFSMKKVTSWLNGEFHFTFINSRTPNEIPFRKTYRLEFELNPYFALNQCIEIKFRNRYELLKHEHLPKLEQKFRQKHEFVFKVGRGQLKNISFNNEIFYNITLNKVFEYRLVPLELRFDVKNEHTLTFYTMIRWRKITLRWHPQFVLGSTLDW